MMNTLHAAVRHDYSSVILHTQWLRLRLVVKIAGRLFLHRWFNILCHISSKG